MSFPKVIHIIGNLDHGGAERFVTDLCNELARKEVDVTLVSLCDNQLHHSLVDQIGDRVKYVSFSKKPGLSIAVIFKLTVWLSNQQPTVVHSHLNGSEYLILYRIFSKRTTFFHTLHNVAEAECPERAIKYLRKIHYRNNKVIPVTISSECSHSYRRYYQLNNDRLIENAREEIKLTAEQPGLVKKYRATSDEIILVHIGRISAEKNQRMLVEAVKQINATETIKCRLLLIGEKKEQQVYDELLALAESDSRIELLGLRKNVADYLSIAHAFCLSSHWEGMPISLIEAMSLGCIPVCTSVGGIPDMITDGVNGFLSRPNHTAAYADALRKVMYGHDLDKMKAKTIQTYKNRYTISVSADRYLNMYHNTPYHHENKLFQHRTTHCQKTTGS